MVRKSHQKYRLEKAYREVSMSIAETEANVYMFNKMIRLCLSTNDIRQFSVNQAAQCRVYKKTNLRIEKVAMKGKRSDALALVKRLRQRKHRVKQSLRSIYKDDPTKAAKKIDDINRRVSSYRTWLKDCKRQKIEHLSGKREITDSYNNISLSSCPRRVQEKTRSTDKDKGVETQTNKHN